MEPKRSLLSYLLDLARDGAKEPGQAEAEQAPLPVQPEAGKPPAEPPRHRLELPQDHTLHKLWSVYSEEAGWQPRPELVLEGKSEAPLPDAVGKSELLRLQILVNKSAHERFDRLQKLRKEAQDGQPASPAADAQDAQPANPAMDAQVVAHVAKDGMAAWVLAYPPVGGGKALDREALERELEAQQISFGVDTALLESLAQDPERYFKLFPIARGVEAVPGANGRIEDYFPRTQERKPVVGEHNRIDFKNLDFIHNVEKDEVICRIVPPTEGKPGRTVQDKEVPAKDGKPEAAPKGRNTELSEDGQALIATISGHVEFSGRSFQVKPVLDIPGNVDFSVGNINFFGDVHIRGDVLGGFSVRATGNITVDGVIEASTIEAGRDLVVAKGIVGDEQTVIRAQKSIVAKFLENCCVYAKVSIETECIINCDVYCDGGVTVRAGYSKIIGGKLSVAHEVQAGTIGSRAQNRTDIVLGGSPCDEFDYQLLTREVRELQTAMARIEREPDSPDKLSRISKARAQLMLSQSKLNAIDKERALAEQEPPEPGVRRMRCDTAFAGTVLAIDGVVHCFIDTVSPCTATLQDGEICLS